MGIYIETADIIKEHSYTVRIIIGVEWQMKYMEGESMERMFVGVPVHGVRTVLPARDCYQAPIVGLSEVEGRSGLGLARSRLWPDVI